MYTKLFKLLSIANIFKLLTFCTLVFICLSCKANKKEISNLANKDKPVVLTTFTILADMARNIAGERLTIKSITKPGAEIHGYQFTPSDLVKAKDASLIVENGLGLEAWINKFTNNLGDLPRVVLSDGMQPLMIEGDAYSGKPNPHAWMSPKRAKHYVDKLVLAFVEIDPLGEKEFINNARTYKSKLNSLDIELREALSKIPIKQRVLVSCEGAFTYLVKDYGLEEAYLWPVNAESQVTPKRMSNLISTVKRRSVPAVFCESTVSSKAQREVARVSGAVFGGDFYVDSLSQPDGPAPTLLKLQRYNLQLLTEGLSLNLNKNESIK